MQIFEDRPYAVCHILTSADGRISGNFFNAPETGEAGRIYSKIRQKYDCTAVLNGTTTCAQIYADGYVDNLPVSEKVFSREDYRADHTEDKYVVCVDTEGRLKWSSNRVTRSGHASQVIEILTEQVSDSYIAYLRSLKISYIFAGKTDFDIPEAMRKLKKLFGIDTLMITGGGGIDWSFLDAGMMDEISLVVSPVISGEVNVATSFDRSEFAPGGPSVSLELADVKKYQGGILWLDYKARNAEH